MLQVQNFPISDLAGLNTFLRKIPPLKNGIFSYEQSVTVLYDDGAPFNHVQQANLIALQLGSLGEQMLEAEANVRLSTKAATAAKARGASKEQVKEVLDRQAMDRKHKQDLLDTMAVLKEMLAEINGDESPKKAR